MIKDDRTMRTKASLLLCVLGFVYVPVALLVRSASGEELINVEALWGGTFLLHLGALLLNLPIVVGTASRAVMYVSGTSVVILLGFALMVFQAQPTTSSTPTPTARRSLPSSQGPGEATANQNPEGGAPPAAVAREAQAKED